MTDYTDIEISNLEPGDPLTDDVMQAFRNNLLAFAEQSPTGDGSPYNAALWHPFDGVRVGDGNDGKIYDHSTDGYVSSISLPTFDSEYAYRIISQGIRPNSNPAGGTTKNYFVELLGSSYEVIANLGPWPAGDTDRKADDVIFHPRAHLTSGGYYSSVTQGRLTASGATMGGSGSTIHLYRRKELVLI